MRFSLLFIFFLLLVEVWSIIQVGHHLGALATVILLIAGVFVGTQLLRYQGIQSLMKGAQTMQMGESPMGTLADGVIKALAGILFIVPGFVSDAIAVILLLPFVRNFLVKKLLTKAQFQGFASGNFSGGFSDVFRSAGLNAHTKPGANDDFAGGNVYEHEGESGAINSDDKIKKESNVIDFKPEKK